MKVCFDIASVGQKKVQGRYVFRSIILITSYSGSSLYECNSYITLAMVKRSFQPSFTASVATRLAVDSTVVFQTSRFTEAAVFSSNFNERRLAWLISSRMLVRGSANDHSPEVARISILTSSSLALHHAKRQA